MRNVRNTDLKHNAKRRTKFARQITAAESRSRYCDWRALETFRDRTPKQLEVLRHLPPHRQLRFGRRRRVTAA